MSKRNEHGSAGVVFLAFALGCLIALGITCVQKANGATPQDKITFCHNENNLHLITTSKAAFFNAGHVDHTGDIFPAGEYKGQSWEAQGDQSLLATGCVAPTEEPTTTPTPTPSETPSQEPSEQPTTTPVPSDTPTTVVPEEDEPSIGSALKAYCVGNTWVTVTTVGTETSKTYVNGSPHCVQAKTHVVVNEEGM